MPVPCPCCKATNASGPACRRCKADLSELFALAAEVESLHARARTRLSRGDAAAAAAIMDTALAARVTPEGLKLRALAGLLARDFPAAWAWHHTWKAACAKSS